jgi:hypothetical protein
MSQVTMPLLVSNLGCEMLYIIHQRLTVQKVTFMRTVLRDIARSLFAREFVEALFAAQKLGSVGAIFQVLSQIVHTSIMRLSAVRCGGSRCIRAGSCPLACA